MLPNNRWLSAAVLAVLIGGLAAWVLADKSPPADELREKPPIGLMTSLPIYWAEADGMDAMLAPPDDAAPMHWVRSALELDFGLVPLDTLHVTGQNDGDPPQVSAQLTELELVILAQPRTLVPADNVALDAWVRGGGRLLFFADPMLTEDSRFAFGDIRRPQDVGLVPPVFARWGLSQNFAEDQPAGEQVVQLEGAPVPVNQRGGFVSLQNVSASGADCKILADGLIAECRVGSGHALLVADAAVLEATSGDVRANALEMLVTRAFSPSF